MSENSVPDWLAWAREIQAIGQTSLTYTENIYEIERGNRLLAIAANIIERHTGLSQDGLYENFQAHLGYATPKIDVRGAVVEGEKILLIREKSDRRWAMPGGWADIGESPSEMVVREMVEESSLKVVPKNVVGIYDANRSGDLALYHAYKIVFMCERVGGEPHPGIETMAAEFFPFDDLPPLSSFRTNERHLSDVFARYRDPSRPTVFD